MKILRLSTLSHTLTMVVFALGYNLSFADTISIPFNTSVSALGEPDGLAAGTYGQTFVVPDANDLVLDSFSFWLLEQTQDPDHVDFQAHV